MGLEQVIWLNPEIIVYHSLYSDFGCSLSEISDRDYPNRHYINDPIEAIDLDSYETSFQGRDNDCTVDAVLGICNERQGSSCNNRHLLVELRMNYTNVNNLDVSNIRQKDVHSRDLLNACPDNTPIDPSLCLVFDPSIISQADRWIYRIQSEHSYTDNWLVFTPITFCSYVNAGRQMPYTPKRETVTLGDRFKAVADTKDLNLLNKEFEDITKYLSICRNRYEKGECSFLHQCMTDVLPQFKSWQFEDADEILEHEILIEDIERLIKSIGNWVNN